MSKKPNNSSLMIRRFIGKITNRIVERLDKSTRTLCRYHPTGLIEWIEYDDKSNPIHIWDSNNYEMFLDYDDSNKIIHAKISPDYEKWFEHDEHGQVTRTRDSNGDECIYTYVGCMCYWTVTRDGNEIESGSYDTRNGEE